MARSVRAISGRSASISHREVIKFDKEDDAVHLSPTGAREVETKILTTPLSGDNGAGRSKDSDGKEM